MIYPCRAVRQNNIFFGSRDRDCREKTAANIDWMQQRHQLNDRYRQGSKVFFSGRTTKDSPTPYTNGLVVHATFFIFSLI